MYDTLYTVRRCHTENVPSVILFFMHPRHIAVILSWRGYIVMCVRESKLVFTNSLVFTRLARTSHDKAVRLSVTRVYCDKKNESSADILIRYETSIHLVF